MNHQPVTFLTPEQLHAMAAQNIKDRLQHLLNDADHLGLVVTIALEPRQPLAMGHYTPVVCVRQISAQEHRPAVPEFRL